MSVKLPVPAMLPMLAALAFAGCESGHIAPYVPRHRTYEPAASGATPAAASAAPGSLYRDDAPAAMLFTDARALRENDLVVVRVEELADARRTSETGVQRDSRLSTEISAFLRAAANATSQPQTGGGLSTKLTSEHDATGTATRTERLTATVPALVRKVLPSGNLFIEGHRVVLVNAEEHHFYVSGVVRPIDIDQDNSVKSSAIADAEIEFTGRGVLSDNERAGPLRKFLGWVWPF